MQNTPGNSSKRGDEAKLVIMGIILVVMSLVMGTGGLIFLGLVVAALGGSILWHRWHHTPEAPGFRPDDADDDE